MGGGGGFGRFRRSGRRALHQQGRTFFIFDRARWNLRGDGDEVGVGGNKGGVDDTLAQRLAVKFLHPGGAFLPNCVLWFLLMVVDSLVLI